MDTTLPVLESPLFEIRLTPTSGRGVFAKQHIPGGTLLHTSPSPTTWVISREYRREVCAECFAYNRGVLWKLRDGESGLGTGVVWCSSECKEAWVQRYGGADMPSVELRALAAVEKLVVRAKGWNNGDWDEIMLDSAAARPSEKEVAMAWENAQECAGLIREARRSNSRKSSVKTLHKVLAEPPAPDILSYLLCAVLASRRRPEEWTLVLDLVVSPAPYASSSRLKQHISAFHQLLAILPAELLDFVRADVCLAASDRDAQNSFGLRSLDDGGSEMFGFGVWASASFWNHSCRPNVTKVRRGRSWIFEAGEDVHEGAELCITYLGGEEKTMDLADRRRRLQDNWRFRCMCVKCTNEEAMSTGQ